MIAKIKKIFGKTHKRFQYDFVVKFKDGHIEQIDAQYAELLTSRKSYCPGYGIAIKSVFLSLYDIKKNIIYDKLTWDIDDIVRIVAHKKVILSE